MATLYDESVEMRDTKASIKKAIEAQGVAVPDTLKIEGYPAKINAIEIKNVLSLEGTGWDTQDCFPLFKGKQNTLLKDLNYTREALKKLKPLEPGRVRPSAFANDKELVYAPWVDWSKDGNLQNMYEGCTNLIAVPDIDASNAYYAIQMFYNCTNLIYVGLISNVEGIPEFRDMFRGCTNLQYFKGIKGITKDLNLNDCTKLTKESILNVINNLGRPGGSGGVYQSPTLSISNTSKGKITENEVAVAVQKGWKVV